MNKLLSIVLALLLSSCSVNDFSFKQGGFEEIRYLDMEIFYVGSEFPSDYEVIGDFYIGNREGCNYDAALNRAADKTKEMGGTAFKIVELLYANPHFGCVRIRGLALRTKEEKCITYYVGWDQRIQSDAVFCEPIPLSPGKENGPIEYKCLFNTKEECLKIDDDSGCIEEEKCNE